MIISYMEEYAIFCKRIDFTEMFVVSLDFADVKTTKTCPRESNSGHIKPVNGYIFIYSDETI